LTHGDRGPLPGDDLVAATARLPETWSALRDRRIVITGGTGFLGRWLLGTLLAAADRYGLGVRIASVSRRPPTHSHPNVETLLEDVRALDVDWTADLVVHAAGPSRARLVAASDDEIEDDLAMGARGVAAYVRRCGARRVLLLSSGAVYEKRARGYAAGKRAAEEAIGELSRDDVEIVIARCFTIFGPGMDTGFAIGDFITAAVAGEPISVADGSATRSYLYAADAAAWLWHLAGTPRAGVYDVGSDEPISIDSLADLVRRTTGGQSDAPVVRATDRTKAALGPRVYLPDIAPARELGLTVWTPLEEGIRKTARWMGSPTV
jgi:dTDP-glucose 4,6-dehydratase